MAERCMALITTVAERSLEDVGGPAHFRILHETEELDSLLHLDCHEGGHALGDWISSQVFAMMGLDERSVDRVSDLYNLAANAHSDHCVGGRPFVDTRRPRDGIPRRTLKTFRA